MSAGMTTTARLLPLKHLPLLLGADAGRTPALLIGQHTRAGQWRILDEVVGVDMGGKQFGEQVARVLAADPYRGLPIGDGWCDPSAAYPRDTDDDADWTDSFFSGSKIRLQAAPTNNLHPRLEAVRQAFTRTIDGDQPGIVISPTCKTLRKALNSNYRYRRIKVAGSDRYDDKPEKSHPWSDICDALQYLLLGGGEYYEVIGRAEHQRGPMQIQAIDDQNPRGAFIGRGVNPRTMPDAEE